MKNAIIIHGWAYKDEYYNPKYPTASNSHWIPWLSKQLMIRDIHTVAVEMPDSYYPKYDIWKKEFERNTIDENTILVGHSCGGGFLVRWMSETKRKVSKVVLVAPWMGEQPDQPFDASFFDFTIDPDITKLAKSFCVFNSSNDDPTIHECVTALLSKLADSKYIELENKGHFTLGAMGTVEFPELLEELIS